MFQHTKAERDDTRKLLDTINKTAGDKAIVDRVLSTAFERGWPELEGLLKTIPKPAKDGAIRPDREILEEILSLTRSISRETPDYGSWLEAFQVPVGPTTLTELTRRLGLAIAPSLITRNLGSESRELELEAKSAHEKEPEPG